MRGTHSDKVGWVWLKLHKAVIKELFMTVQMKDSLKQQLSLYFNLVFSLRQKPQVSNSNIPVPDNYNTSELSVQVQEVKTFEISMLPVQEVLFK